MSAYHLSNGILFDQIIKFFVVVVLKMLFYAFLHQFYETIHERSNTLDLSARLPIFDEYSLS